MVKDKKALLEYATQRLAKAGIDNSRYEAQILLAFATGCRDRLALLQSGEVSSEQEEHLRQILARRVKREPMAFILGEQGFWTLDFEVSPASLIPRADSETLIEALLACRPKRESVHHILDLGTGTGCLLLAALSEYKEARGTGLDISAEAILLARRNAQRNTIGNMLAERVEFIADSWMVWAGKNQTRFDVVLSNPPYIETAAMAELMPEVRDYEPHRALEAGADGLEAYRQICEILPALLTSEGCAILELGFGQQEAVTALAASYGLDVRECRADLGGIPRALVLERKILDVCQQI